jgi:hypothetical protein
MVQRRFSIRCIPPKWSCPSDRDGGTPDALQGGTAAPTGVTAFAPAKPEFLEKYFKPDVVLYKNALRRTGGCLVCRLLKSCKTRKRSRQLHFSFFQGTHLRCNSSLT